jgi:zinc protease
MIWRAGLCLVAVFLTGSVGAAPPALPAFPPLEFHPPKPERYQLPNGLTVYLLEDHEIPLIQVQSTFRAGTQYDPPDKVGLGALFGDVMTQGGSAAHRPEEIERILDKTAATISFSLGLEHGSGSLTCRRENFGTVFPLYVDLYLHPQFRKDQLEIAKAKSREALRRLNDSPEDVARREFRKIIYGPTHPYARVASPDSINAIKRDDLVALHATYFKPNGAFIAVSGDFVSADIKKELEKAFSGWTKGEIPAPPAAPVTWQPKREVYYIQRPINQSQIRVGQTGLARHNPDHFAWEVFNELWGGGAASRLFRVVRTQQGLAYSVGSGFSEPSREGLIVAVSQTRGAQTIAAIQSILKITRETSAAPFTAEEIKGAQDAIRNRFVENFTSSSQIAAELMNNEYFGFPPDYLDTYPERIGRVTEADLRRVGKTYMHPDQSAILVVGDLSTFDKPISTLGSPKEIKLLDYSQEP